jgi:hypothetical protein
MKESDYVEIELLNGSDVIMNRHEFIKDKAVRRIIVNAHVASNGVTLTINEYVQYVLQLPITGKRKLLTGTGDIEEYKVAGPVEVRYKGRSNTCNAVIIPHSQDVAISATHRHWLAAEIILMPTITPL